MRTFLKERLTKVTELCKSHHVGQLYVFGSVLRADFGTNSDIDLLVRFEKVPKGKYVENYFGLKEQLEDLFNRQVDLTEEETLQNPYFKKIIEETKQLLYARGQSAEVAA